jgi:two-component system, LuxR family, response regulator FixJ
MSHQRTVYVVDGDLHVRRSLSSHLAAIGAEGWPFTSGAEFLEIVDHLMPACILLDMDMEPPGGLELLAALARRELGWPVIAMSASAEVATAVAAMKLGAIDFLEKPVSGQKLAAALIPAWSALETSVRKGEAKRAAQERLSRLTARELDIALALFGGQSNKAVAHELGISVRTVEMHRAHVMAKLGVRSIAEAAIMAAHAELTPAGGAPPRNPAPPSRLARPAIGFRASSSSAPAYAIRAAV